MVLARAWGWDHWTGVFTGVRACDEISEISRKSNLVCIFKTYGDVSFD